MDEKLKKILSSFQRQCARREYCSSDILKKALSKTEGDESAAKEILSSLKKDGFVSDLRYASAFAREKSGIGGWGSIKIAYALKAKGIDRDTINEALEEIDSVKAENKLRKVMETKWKSLKGTPDAKLKLLKFALSRGYEYEQVKKMAELVTTESASDDI